MTSRTYGVRLVRGPFVRLEPHADACTDEASLLGLVERLRETDPDRLLAADLFSGAGGLSLGLQHAGITTVFAVDHDKEAVETHRHHFPGMTVDWDLSEPSVIDRVSDLLRRAQVDVIAGGPPCQPFSKAGRSGIRHQVKHGLRDPHDRRRDLWRSFLEIVRQVQPRAVLMENVPDMALDREMFILRSMVLELERLGYSVEERVVETWRYGVPQFRSRLIMVALRDALKFDWPEERGTPTTVDNAIGDLPPVEGGFRPDGGAEGWIEYEQPLTSYQRKMRAGVARRDTGKVYDHITRPVRDDDALAFEVLDIKTRYSELPEEYKRYRDDIFDDKYKRLNADDLSRTITAHIAKDGYWYIHPYQDRTITIREAARLQSFPDSFRFAGPPSAAFRQIGNAVPPMLGEVLGRALVTAVRQARPAGPSSESLAGLLAEWFATSDLRGAPWLKAKTRWQVISAETLLDKIVADQMPHLWPFVRRFETPKETLAAASDLTQWGNWTGRQERVDNLLRAAEALQETPTLDDAALTNAVEKKIIPPGIADIAALVVDVGPEDASEEPVIVSKGVIRLVGRFHGEDGLSMFRKLTDGRVAVAGMIGYGENSRAAHLALLELSTTVCRPRDPDCPRCPLAGLCLAANV